MRNRVADEQDLLGLKRKAERRLGRRGDRRREVGEQRDCQEPNPRRDAPETATAAAGRSTGEV